MDTINKSIKSKEQLKALKGTSTIIKRDTLQNWQKAVNYIPNSNVLIVIDNPDGTSDIKLGNGEDKVNELDVLISGRVDVKTPIVEDGVLVF